MRIAQKIKGMGIGLGVVALLIASLIIPVIFIVGITRISFFVAPWLRPAFNVTLFVCIFLLGPLAIFRKTRAFSASCMMVATFIFGAILWIASIIVTLYLWGIGSVIFGLLLSGVGIVPVAMAAALFHAQWSVLGSIAIMLGATIGAGVLSLWISPQS